MKIIKDDMVRFIHSRSAHLALSYLAIIIVLCVSFSVVLYRVSTANLDIQLQATTGRISVGTKSNQRPMQPPYGGYVGTIVEQGHSAGTNKNLSALNRQLKQHVGTIRTDLLRRLIILNIGVLFIGAGLSYYLARRTLRPIEVAMEAQSRFASDASHELRTPLTVMQSENEGALRTLALPERARAILKSNLEEITQLKELSEGLLQLAREIPPGKLRSVWIDEVAAQATNRVANLAKAKSNIINVTVPHVQVLADEQSLMQAIIILLDNAIEYGHHEATIYVEGHVDGKYVYLIVRDEGPGIEKEDLPHIFDRFYRAEHSRKQHPTGYGLGLSIAQRLVSQQHGTIAAESTVGEGSTFTITLPASMDK